MTQDALHSSVCHGWVSHRRVSPKVHDFRYRTSMLLLDLDEARTLFNRRWLWSYERRNVAAVLRDDHFKSSDADLVTAVYETIAREGLAVERGPVSLLTQPRYFGFCFNPISWFIVWSADRQRIQCVICEVNNTPWGEQIHYVLPAPADQRRGVTVRFDKRMHVSPFMPMDMTYGMNLRIHSDRIAVHLENERNGKRVFAANLALRRRPATAAALASLLLATPLMTAKVVAAIYFEAARLWLKRVPYVPHPNKTNQKLGDVT